MSCEWCVVRKIKLINMSKTIKIRNTSSAEQKIEVREILQDIYLPKSKLFIDKGIVYSFGDLELNECGEDYEVSLIRIESDFLNDIKFENPKNIFNYTSPFQTGDDKIINIPYLINCSEISFFMPANSSLEIGLYRAEKVNTTWSYPNYK